MSYANRGPFSVFNAKENADKYQVGLLDYKIFKFVKSKKHVSWNMLMNKFKKYSLVDDRVNNLSNKGYLELFKMEGYEENRFVLAPIAENFLHEVKEEKYYKNTTVFISYLSLFVSIVAIIVSIVAVFADK